MRPPEIQELLNILKPEYDELLAEHARFSLDTFENQLSAFPFMEPPANSQLTRGDILLAQTLNSTPIKITFIPGHPGVQGTHIATFGQTKTGKSTLLSHIAEQAAGKTYTLVIDSQKHFRNIPSMRRTHDFILMRDLRINIWDGVEGLSHHISDQIVNHELCKSYGLKFAEYELGLNTEKLRITQKPNIPDTIKLIEQEQKQRYSKRFDYRISLLVVMTNLLRATGSVFRCSKGMNLEELLKNNLVIEMEGLPEHQVFIIRYLFEYIHMLTLAGKKFDRPFLFILDEGQLLSINE